MRRRYSLLHYKGVLLILLWVTLAYVCDPSIAEHIEGTLTPARLLSSFVLLLLYFLLPLITLVADTKFGGYHFTIVSLVVGFITCGMYIIHQLLDIYGYNTSLSQTLLYILSPLHRVNKKSFVVFMVLYGADLMPDACSEQLSSFIWSYTWCVHMGMLITVIMTCSLCTHLSKAMGLFYIDTVNCLSLLIIFISCVAFKKKVQTNFKRSSNPLSLIKNVLVFAKKSPYPSGRSSLTYWEDTRMSRIDSAKKSYGGPFEEEDVESVKSFFRLLPFLVCIGLTFTPPNPLRRFRHSSYATFDCLMGSTYFMEYIVVLLCISFNYFNLNPAGVHMYIEHWACCLE